MEYSFMYFYNTYTIKMLKPPYKMIYEGVYTHILSYSEMENKIKNLTENAIFK